MDVANLNGVNAANNSNNVQQINANNNQLSNIPGHQIPNAGNNNVANPAAQQIPDKSLNQRNTALDKSMNDEISELKASLSEAFVKIDDSKKMSNTFDEKSILGRFRKISFDIISKFGSRIKGLMSELDGLDSSKKENLPTIENVIKEAQKCEMMIKLILETLNKLMSYVYESNKQIAQNIRW